MTYPLNRTHRQVLEDAVRQPWITMGVVRGSGGSCPLTGAVQPLGATCWSVQDVGVFARRPTEDEARDLARERLAELDRLGISTECVGRGPAGLLPSAG